MIAGAEAQQRRRTIDEVRQHEFAFGAVDHRRVGRRSRVDQLEVHEAAAAEMHARLVFALAPEETEMSPMPIASVTLAPHPAQAWRAWPVRPAITCGSVGRCACGRTAPRVRCVGRTDDMLIVRGVNVFPSAVREVVNEFAPAVAGVIMIRPRAPGVRQEPPLPIRVELRPERKSRASPSASVRGYVISSW